MEVHRMEVHRMKVCMERNYVYSMTVGRMKFESERMKGIADRSYIPIEVPFNIKMRKLFVSLAKPGMNFSDLGVE